MKTNPRVILVGVVRNCEKHFSSEYERLLRATKSLNIVDSFFVESDSSDNTVSILERNSKSRGNFHFKTLGKLSNEFPNRIERIRHCRNEYVKYIKDIHTPESLDYVIVADMDGINSALTKLAINSCFSSSNWDALFSNQLFGVSDLLALRAENWVDEDIFVSLEKSRLRLRNSVGSKNPLKKIYRFMEYDFTRKKHIYDKMKILGLRKKFIPVFSAFGGIAIYRSWCMFEFDYSTTNDPKECEHVSFHHSLYTKNAQLFINPRFVNSIVNTYNANKFFLIRNMRMWRWNRMNNHGVRG